MIDNSDVLLGIYTGLPGGTKNALEYAKLINKQIILIRADKNFEVEK